jgi:hypothetical protein
MRIKITVDDPFLIEYWGIHKGAVCNVIKEKGGYYYINARVSETAPCNGKGNKVVIRIKESECNVLRELINKK